MKRRFYLIIFALFCCSAAIQAQTIDQEDLREDFKEMEDQLNKMMQQFDQLFSGSHFQQDTTITRMFTFPMDELGNQFQMIQPDSLMNGDMMNWMNGQMQMFSQQDWTEIEKLFKSFGEQFQMMPAPEFHQDGKTPNQKDKKKKRKTTTL